MQAQKYEEAYKLFSRVGSYRDADEKETECYIRMQFGKGLEYYENGDYEKAIEAFETFEGYEDAASYLALCEGIVHFDNGEYAAAYARFRDAGDFHDAEARMKECIQPWPDSNGVIDEGPAYSDGGTGTEDSSVIQFYNMTSQNMCLLIYDDDSSEYWGAVFMNAKSGKFDVNFKKGYYKINCQTGSLWFGENDKFGSEATEELYSVDGGRTRLDFRNDVRVTLKEIFGYESEPEDE